MGQKIRFDREDWLTYLFGEQVAPYYDRETDSNMVVHADIIAINRVVMIDAPDPELCSK